MTIEKGYVDDRSRLEGRRRDRARAADAGAPRRGATTASTADRGRVALQRGPIVYAAEWPDNPGGKVRNLVLPDADSAHDRVPARPAERRDGDQGTRVRPRVRRRRAASPRPSSRSCAIPYATWANRGPGQMIVWLARTDAARSRRRFRRSRRRSTVTHSPSREEHAARRSTARSPASSTIRIVVLRLVADSGERREWVEMTVRKARDGVARRRSTGSTTPAKAAYACRHAGGCSTKMASSGSRSRQPANTVSRRTATTPFASSRSRPRCLDWS